MSISIYNLVDSALQIDVWVLIAHILAVTILLFVISFFAWKPTKKYIAERKKNMQEEINKIAESKKIAESNIVESKELKMKSIDEASKIIELAEIDAYSIKEKIKKEATIDANHIKDMANEDILKKEKELRTNIESEVSNLAIELAESLIKKNIDKKANQKLINSLLEDIKKL
ncbi:MAG: F0F1 ATP synthase subunit B [Mycoplasmoidaceae bacterium]